MAKQERFSKYNADLKQLSDYVASWGRERGFEVRVNDSTPNVWQVQLYKEGLFRLVVGARRSLDCLITGNPEDFQVGLTTGKWGENIGTAVLISVFTLGVGLIAGAAGAAEYHQIEEDLWKNIRGKVDSLRNTWQPAMPVQAVPITNNPVLTTAGRSGFCVECGAALPPNAKFCAACGTKVQLLAHPQ